MLLFQRVKQAIFLDNILVKLDMMSEHHWKLTAKGLLLCHPVCFSPYWMFKSCGMCGGYPISLKTYKLKNFKWFFSLLCISVFAILQLIILLLKYFLLRKLLFSINLNPIFLIISLAENKNNFPLPEKQYFIYLSWHYIHASSQMIWDAYSVVIQSYILFPFSLSSSLFTDWVIQLHLLAFWAQSWL